MDTNTVEVRAVKDLTQDEQNTANLEAMAFLGSAIESGKRYIVAVLNGSLDDEDGSVELNGCMSGRELDYVARTLQFQAILGQADDPQALLDRLVADNSVGEAA